MNILFSLGSNGSGQLGINHKEDVSVPKQTYFHPEPPPATIKKIAAGGNHTLLLTTSGQLYWSGEFASGACGIASASASDLPVFREARLTRDDSTQKVGRIELIAATWEASIVVAQDDEGKKTEVFSFGVGMKGELGLGELIVRTPSATKIKDFPPPGLEVIDIAACMGHVVAVLSNGEAYGWGNCRKLQIGEPGEVIHAPRKIEGIGFKVARAVCAKESTCLFGAPETGEIHVLGSDKWELSSKAPSDSPSWLDVAASWGNFYILKQDGGLEAWGRDDHGQLPPPNLPPLQKIAVGSEHVVALTQSGDIVSWGWGEHGNCGPQVVNNDVKGRWNVIASSKLIPPQAQFDTIGAGCATSWINITAR